MAKDSDQHRSTNAEDRNVSSSNDPASSNGESTGATTMTQTASPTNISRNQESTRTGNIRGKSKATTRMKKKNFKFNEYYNQILEMKKNKEDKHRVFDINKVRKNASMNFKDGKTNAMNVGTWLCNVKSSYKAEQNGTKPCLIISSEDYQKLKDIGLKLGDDQDNRTNNDNFQSNVIKLSNFKAEYGHVCIPPEHELYQWMSSMTELKNEGKLELNSSNVLDAIGVVWFSVIDGITELVNLDDDHVIQDGTSLYNWVIDVWSKYKKSQLTTQDKNLVESFRIFSREDVKNVIERAQSDVPILNSISSSTSDESRENQDISQSNGDKNMGIDVLPQEEAEEINIDDEDPHHAKEDEETEEMCLDGSKPSASTNDGNDFDTGYGKPPASTNDGDDFDTGSGNGFHDDSNDDDDEFLQIGPPPDENNLVQIKRHHRYGFPKAKCYFCKRNTTQCFCFEKLFASTPWAVIDNEKVCGKPFCIECAAEEENRTTCKDCIEYTTSDLDELDESRMKDLCNARGLLIGKKKMPGMKKLILADQNEKLGRVDSTSKKRKVNHALV